MTQPFLVHRLDPILFSIGGIHFWWYGLSYALGFLQLSRWLESRRATLGLNRQEAARLSLGMMLGILLGGRAVEVVFYESDFYWSHPQWIPALWLGGMATHGLLLGGVAVLAIFCLRRGHSFLHLADHLAVPAAIILGLGRLGNFMDGQIVGAVTQAPWAIQFPDAEGFRHPVVLYDGLKNLALVPWLLAVQRKPRPAGAVTARFLVGYAGLRIGIDVFREYPTTLLGLATGQSLNIAMTLAGLLLWMNTRRKFSAPARTPTEIAGPVLGCRLAQAALMLFSLTIPSDWTQDIVARYGARHPGLTHSAWYPAIDTRPRHKELQQQRQGPPSI